MNETKELFTSERLKDAGEFPKVVLLDTVSYCNLKCSMCGHKDMKRKRGKMSWDLYTKLIDEIACENKDTRVWLVFFGEVLLLKNTILLPMIRYAKEKGLTDVVTNTNGNLLDEKTAEGLIKAGLDGIYVGIDAFSPETYSKIRIGGNYEQTVTNVRNLIKIKKRMGAENPEVHVQFVEMDENGHEVEDFKEFWMNQGAIVKIRPKVSWAGLIDTSHFKVGVAGRWPCYWAMQTMSVTDDGKVVLCAVDVDARFVAGDANKESLKSIWNGTLKKLRTLQLNGQYDQLPFPCNECLDWQAARADFYTVGE